MHNNINRCKAIHHELADANNHIGLHDAGPSHDEPRPVDAPHRVGVPKFSNGECLSSGRRCDRICPAAWPTSVRTKMQQTLEPYRARHADALARPGFCPRRANVMLCVMCEFGSEAAVRLAVPGGETYYLAEPPAGADQQSVECVATEAGQTHTKEARMVPSTRPVQPLLMTGLAMTSAAALVIATPIIDSPPDVFVANGSGLRPLSSAQYELAAISDITIQGINDAYWSGWGGYITSSDTYYSGVSDVYVTGLSGVLYYLVDNTFDSISPNVDLDNYFFEIGSSQGG
ncbi:hypothetical protein H7J51_25550 [Mycobacterium crocinum]|uniref:Uncharacterized protein n=1 Tax=Mycolicibacterium crocinum TaxID=388459 RepID=A0ABY3THK3_9MYCO|nr:hypothetical protein [Mycolicibacterium crocinum]MCV7218628.1 hypothetical protein [Mycolicibacterium crocinum]ULN39224.1 hypothetical protein MI149_15710 [Mycolicibacterium crocinum]